MRHAKRTVTSESTNWWPVIVAISIVAAGVWWVNRPQANTPSGGDPALAAAFVGEHALRDAKVLATLLRSLADVIRFDGERKDAAGKAAPRLITGVQIDDLRRHLRELRLRGGSLSARYPALGPRLDAVLREAVGTDGGAVDDAKRGRWIEALERLATDCELIAAR